MALRILQFGIVFAIGYYLGPASPFAGAVDVVPEVPLSIQLKDPKDVIVSRGQSAILHCDANSLTPGLQITWLHNDVPIKSNDTRRFLQDDGSLYFPKVGGGKKSKSLTGEYRCRASAQNVSMLSNPAKLKLASFGDFDKQPSNLSVPESQPAVLFCNINSVPAAQIKWEQNTKSLPHNTRYVPLPTGALLITETHSSDAGSYRCIATNNLLKKTKHSKIVQLTVSSVLMQTVAPTFLPLDILPNTTVLVGESVNLYCAVSGWPIPTIQWLNNNSIVISNSTVLQFRNVSLQDSGNYTCIAYNSGGRNIQKFSLDVQQKPYFNITPASKKYPQAKTVRLDCQAKGVPKPKIYWLKDGEPLPNAARIKKHPTGLVISHTFTSDAGIYQCIAVNAAGKVWAAAQLVPTFVDIPSPPENVQCRPFDDTSICLTWQSPQNVSIKAYSIHCSYIAKGSELPGAEFVTNKTQYLASGLNGSTNYTCYIRLYSSMASDGSQNVTCKTGVKGRRNLQVIPVNETAVELSWSKVSTDVPCDGTSRFYKIQWKRKGRPSEIHTEDFSYIISGLVPSVEYEFRVIPAWLKTDNSPWASFTPKGDSSRRSNTNITDLIPLAPENVEAGRISPTSINLTWVDNSENTRFYSICMVESKNHVDCDEKDLLKSASTSLFITDLQPNSSYDFKVRAQNYDGYFGPFSQSITIRTLADVPSKVLNLNYEIVNETTACLHWQAPLHKNGRLTGYLVLYTPNADWPLDEWLNKSVPTTQNKMQGCKSGTLDDQTFSTLLVGLQPDKQYSVYVRATSEVGLGNPIFPIKISTTNIKTIDQRPESQDDVHYNQNLGIIMGVTITLVSLVFCISCTILVRKRCLKNRAFARARMAASNNYYPAVAQYASEGSSVQVRLENPCSATIHEIEHLVSDDGSNHITPDTPAHLDTKGSDGFPNGHINGSAKPYINGHIANGIVHITENPRYYALEYNGHVEPKTNPEEMCCSPYEEDSNSNLKTSKFHDLHRIFENSKVPVMTNKANRQPKNSKIKINDSKCSSGFKDVRPNG